jgi:hypothetical protein
MFDGERRNLNGGNTMPQETIFGWRSSRSAPADMSAGAGWLTSDYRKSSLILEQGASDVTVDVKPRHG